MVFEGSLLHWRERLAVTQADIVLCWFDSNRPHFERCKMDWPIEQGWENWRNDRLAEYPCEEGKWRYDIELRHPRRTLEEVPIERNPHTHGGGFTGHSCFYRSGDYWSTIFPVQRPPWDNKQRMLVESGNSNPVWGEQIELFSTSSSFQDESWGHNVANKFAYFRNAWWLVTFNELLHHNEEVRNQRRFPMQPYPEQPVAGPLGIVMPRIFRIPTFARDADPVLLADLNWVRYRPQDQEKVNWQKEGF